MFHLLVQRDQYAVRLHGTGVTDEKKFNRVDFYCMAVCEASICPTVYFTWYPAISGAYAMTYKPHMLQPTCWQVYNEKQFSHHKIKSYIDLPEYLSCINKQPLCVGIFRNAPWQIMLFYLCIYKYNFFSVTTNFFTGHIVIKVLREIIFGPPICLKSQGLTWIATPYQWANNCADIFMQGLLRVSYIGDTKMRLRTRLASHNLRLLHHWWVYLLCQ